jgi:hypothetical protein
MSTRKTKPSEKVPGSTVTGTAFSATTVGSTVRTPTKSGIVTELLDTINIYVDSRVGSDWLQPDIDTILSYTDKLEAQGIDTSKIETFVKQRGFSPWQQSMADTIHAMVNELR